jgi:hypothetical protein
MTARAPSLPMAPDVRYLWGRLSEALATRGLLEGTVQLGRQRVSRRELAEVLAFAVAMERRTAIRLADLPSVRDRQSGERIRAHLRHRARIFAGTLGLIPANRVDAAPVDAQGHDPELAELIPFDAAELEAAALKSLTTGTITNREE